MLDVELDALKGDEAALRKELESAGVQFRGRTCRCPFHDDHNPSGGIFIKKGVWFYKCHVCGVTGTILDVRALLNKRSVADELRAMNERTGRPYRAPQREAGRTVAEQKAPRTFPTIEAMRDSLSNVEGLYRYTHPVTGVVELVVLRYRDTNGKKHFVQASPAPTGGFWLKAPEGKLPIYNRSRIANAEYVVIVEGEKAAHALHDIGIVATTSPGGALKAHNADWSPLAGKRVYDWADFDPINPADHPQNPGERTGFVHMQQVEKIVSLLTPPPELLRIDVEALELPEKGDAYDFVQRYDGWKPEDIKALIEAELLADAKTVGIMGDYRAHVEATIAGKNRVLPLPWDNLWQMSRCLMAGTVMCLVGAPGSTKSLLLLESLIFWNQYGVKAAINMLEDPREKHMDRLLAQIAKESNITDPEWVRCNPLLMRGIVSHHYEELETNGRCLWDAPEEQTTLEMLGVWVEERAKAGYEIIVVDPVTAAEPEGKQWIADCKFIVKVKAIARRYNCRIILVVHAKKGHKTRGLDDMAGGAAYGRLCHSVIWLSGYDEPGELMVRSNPNYPSMGVHPNRMAEIVKARNGPGAGRRIAFWFDVRSLTFKELGVVEKS